VLAWALWEGRGLWQQRSLGSPEDSHDLHEPKGNLVPLQSRNLTGQASVKFCLYMVMPIAMVSACLSYGSTFL